MWSVAEHKQYKAGALKRKRQVKQSGRMELIEVKKFNLGAKWETLYNL
jgi:hypothetical protein